MASSTNDQPKAPPATRPSLRSVKPPPTAQPPAVSEEVEALRRQLVAVQRVSSLGVLAGGICHELNNALTPVLNYAKLGMRNPDPDFRARAFEKILEAAQRASTITGGVLGLARPPADPPAPAHLVRLVQEVLLPLR